MGQVADFDCNLIQLVDLNVLEHDFGGNDLECWLGGLIIGFGGLTANRMTAQF